MIARGFEEEFQSWIIPGYMTSLRDLEKLINDIWDDFKCLETFLLGQARPKDFSFEYSEVPQYIITVIRALDNCLGKCCTLLPQRLADATAARDARIKDNEENNKTQFMALLALQRAEILVKELTSCLNEIPETINQLAAIESELENQAILGNGPFSGLTAAHQVVSMEKVKILQTLETAVKLNEKVHIILSRRAHKLQVYKLSDTQRQLNETLAMFYVESIDEKRSRLIEKRLLEICRSKNLPVIICAYDGASHALVRRSGMDGETPTLITSLVASIAKDLDKLYVGYGKTKRMKTHLLEISKNIVKNASWIKLTNHRASKWFKVPPIATAVEIMHSEDFSGLLDTIIVESKNYLSLGSWHIFREAIWRNQEEFDGEAFNFESRINSIRLDSMDIVDADGVQVWAPFLFSFLCTLCRLPVLKFHETREWLVRHLFLEQTRSEPFWLDHFYKPDRNSADPTHNIWKIIDPPHFMKRLSTQISGVKSGYKDFTDRKLYIQIAETLETKLLPLFFTKYRDKMNVLDAFSLFGLDVELKAQEFGNRRVASFLRLVRRFYEACDSSGLSAEHRNERFDDMWEWLELHYFPEVFGNIPSDSVPARPHGDRDLEEPVFFRWENKALPSELMEAIASFIDIRNQVKSYLESESFNNPDSILASLVERAMGTNNLETEMSILRLFEGILTSGRVSQVDPIKAHLSVRKVRYTQLLQLRLGADIDIGYREAPSRGRSYKEHDEGRWEAELGDEDTINTNRHAKETSADKMKNSSALALRDSTIRDKHRVNMDAVILTSSKSLKRKQPIDYDNDEDKENN
ncbi:hypothetical protein BDR26DRAFT_371642 [Obelidium mucronatum]|nr:hypothetical protein BDR26DRAFT_371642 [Obelidium mucronatum]